MEYECLAAKKCFSSRFKKAIIAVWVFATKGLLFLHSCKRHFFPFSCKALFLTERNILYMHFLYLDILYVLFRSE